MDSYIRIIQVMYLYLWQTFWTFKSLVQETWRLWNTGLLAWWARFFFLHGGLNPSTGSPIYEDVQGKQSSFCQTLVCPYLQTIINILRGLISTRSEPSLVPYPSRGDLLVGAYCNLVYFHRYILLLYEKCKLINKTKYLECGFF